MKKLIIPFIILSLSWCSIDWNNEKDKKIAQLQKELDDDAFKKNLECNEFYQKNKESIYWTNAEMFQYWIWINTIWYSRNLSTCFVAYYHNVPDTQTTLYTIDNIVNKNNIFLETSFGTSIDEQISIEKKFKKKIQELLWE